MPTTPATLTRPPPATGVERILAAAEQLFASQGFDAASISAIAQQAGVSKANIFYHFATKRDLYLAVLAQACRESGSLLLDMETNPAGFGDKLRRYATQHLSSILEHEQFSRLILRELLENGPKSGQELAQQGFGDNFARLVNIMRGAMAGGELRQDVDPAMAAVLLIAADVFFFEARDVLRHYPDVSFSDDPPRYSSMLVDILLHGMLRLPSTSSSLE